MIRLSRYRVLWLATIILWIWIPYCVQAQSGYIEESVWSNVDPASGLASDFIITSTGDKLFGRLVRNFDYTEYDKVEFENNETVTTYFPSDLTAFGLNNGRFFMSKKLPESTEQVFVQILLSGRLQLDYKKGRYYLDNGYEIQELRSFYQDISTPGDEKKRRVNLYISILKILTAGKCGLEIKDLIERARLEEQDLIRILTQYHSCEELPFKVHVDKIPFVKFSPIVGLGLGTSYIKSSENEYSRASSIDQPFYFQVEGGLKFHDFRKSPRMSFDLRFEYHMMSSSWSISQANSSILVTGSQKFKQRSILIPFSVNYSFYKRDELNLYFGVSAGVMFNSMNTQEGFIDFTYLNSNETYLSNMKLVDINPSLFIPGLKLGSSIPINKKRSIYAEIQAKYAREMYLTFLPNSNNVGCNSTLVSFNVGFEF